MPDSFPPGPTGSTPNPVGDSSRPNPGGSPLSPTGPSVDEPGTLRPQAPPSEGRHDLLGLWRGKSPHAIYRFLTQGDPFHLVERCAGRLRQAAYLVDVDRLVERSIARIAVLAPDYDGRLDVGEWFSMCIDEVLVALVREDQEAQRVGHVLLDEWDPRYAFLTDTLGIEPGSTRRACVAFNGLAPRVRSAFFALVLEGRSIEHCVASGVGSREALRERTKLAFSVLFGVRSPLDQRETGRKSL